MAADLEEIPLNRGGAGFSVLTTNSLTRARVRKVSTNTHFRDLVLLLARVREHLGLRVNARKPSDPVLFMIRDSCKVADALEKGFILPRRYA
jgi:hypothetical protein